MAAAGKMVEDRHAGPDTEKRQCVRRCSRSITTEVCRGSVRMIDGVPVAGALCAHVGKLLCALSQAVAARLTMMGTIRRNIGTGFRSKLRV